jgi:hypothetical protein
MECSYYSTPLAIFNHWSLYMHTLPLRILRQHNRNSVRVTQSNVGKGHLTVHSTACLQCDRQMTSVSKFRILFHLVTKEYQCNTLQLMKPKWTMWLWFWTARATLCSSLWQCNSCCFHSCHFMLDSITVNCQQNCLVCLLLSVALECTFFIYLSAHNVFLTQKRKFWGKQKYRG